MGLEVGLRRETRWGCGERERREREWRGGDGGERLTLVRVGLGEERARVLALGVLDLGVKCSRTEVCNVFVHYTVGYSK